MSTVGREIYLHAILDALIVSSSPESLLDIFKGQLQKLGYSINRLEDVVRFKNEFPDLSYSSSFAFRYYSTKNLSEYNQDTILYNIDIIFSHLSNTAVDFYLRDFNDNFFSEFKIHVETAITRIVGMAALKHMSEQAETYRSLRVELDEQILDMTKLIENIENKQLELENKITTIDDKHTILNVNVEATTSNYGQLKSNIDGIEGRYTTFEGRMNSLGSNIYINIIAVLGVFVAMTMVFFGGVQVLGDFIAYLNMSFWQVFFAILFTGFLIFSMFNSLMSAIARLTDKSLTVCSITAMAECKHKNKKKSGCKNNGFKCRIVNKHLRVLVPNIVFSVLVLLAFFIMIISHWRYLRQETASTTEGYENVWYAAYDDVEEEGSIDYED